MGQQVLNAIFIGSIYALFAVGYTLVFGVLDILNLAHSAVFMLGAAVAYSLVVNYNQSFAVACVGGILACVVMGLVIEFVGVVLNFCGEVVGIQGGLHELEMFDELKRDVLRVDLQRSLAAITDGEQNAEEGLVPAVNFFKFLGVHGERDSDLP